MKRLAVLIASLGLVLASVGCKTLTEPEKKAESGSPVLDRVFQTGILRVGMSGDQPPFNMTTTKGQIIGMEADLANALADSMGVRAEFDKKPFGELLKALEKGEVDLVLSQVTMTTARNTRVAFVGPYFISGKAILTRSKTLGEADEVEDINMTGIRLSALAGSTSEAFIRRGRTHGSPGGHAHHRSGHSGRDRWQSRRHGGGPTCLCCRCAPASGCRPGHNRRPLYI